MTCLPLVLEAALLAAAMPVPGSDAGPPPPSAVRDAGVQADGGTPPRYSLHESQLPVVAKSSGPSRRQAQVLASPQTMGTQAATLTHFKLEGDLPPAFHKHTAAEFLVVLDGALLLEGATRTWVLQTGDAAFLPAGAVHHLSRPDAELARDAGVDDIMSSPANVLALYAPPGPELTLQDKKDPHTSALKSKRPSKADAKGPQPVVIFKKQTPPYSIAQGNGSATLLLEQDTIGGATSAYAGWLELGPGASVPKHVHAGEEEFLYILSGTSEMLIAGQREVLGPGSVVHVPANTPHSATITSKTPMVAVQFYAPGGPEQRFKLRP